MVSIDELTVRFGPSLQVAPWGECLVIQGTEFQSQWEQDLGNLGFRCHQGDLDRHAVIFVQLKKTVVPGHVVYVPPKNTEVGFEALRNPLQLQDRQPEPPVISEVQNNEKVIEVKDLESEKKQKRNAHANNGDAWTDPEDDLIVALWTQVPALTVNQLIVKFKETFPKRSDSAVTNRIHVMQHLPESQIKIREAHQRATNATSATKDTKSEKSIIAEADPAESSIKVTAEETILSLVKKYEILSEAYDSLSRGYLELRGKIDESEEDLKAVSDMVSDGARFAAGVADSVAVLKKQFANHEHSEKTGKPTITLEAIL